MIALPHMSETDVDYEDLMSIMARSMRPNQIRRLTPLLARGDMISFAAGAPSPETFPYEELAEMSARAIRDNGRIALQYGPTRGQGKLLQEIAAYMTARGTESEPAHIVMTSGSQQGLDLASRVLLDPGDIALVELPSYVGGMIALHNSRADLRGIAQDKDGMVIEDLEEKLKTLSSERRRVKCVYTIPNFQNPSGVTLAADRRHRLIEIAEKYDFLIIEDDPYAEIYFDDSSSRLTPLSALCPSRVIYLSSFSKVLAPGLRMAWVRAPKLVAERIELAKEGADLNSSQLDQSIVLEAVSSGLVQRRLPFIRQFYAARCRAMLDALTANAAGTSRWTVPVGGFFILVTVADGIDTAELLPSMIERGVAYVPGQSFFCDYTGANTIRLAFSKESPEKIAEGIGIMCRGLRERTAVA